ncbi:hypothetical protein GCM10027161_34230 [Microbispora hainanensis]
MKAARRTTRRAGHRLALDPASGPDAREFGPINGSMEAGVRRLDELLEDYSDEQLA